MKLVSGSRSRDGIATVSSWTEINQGAIHTDVTAGCRVSITLLIIARLSRFQLAVRASTYPMTERFVATKRRRRVGDEYALHKLHALDGLHRVVYVVDISKLGW